MLKYISNLARSNQSCATRARSVGKGKKKQQTFALKACMKREVNNIFSVYTHVCVCVSECVSMSLSLCVCVRVCA